MCVYLPICYPILISFTGGSGGLRKKSRPPRPRYFRRDEHGVFVDEVVTRQETSEAASMANRERVCKAVAKRKGKKSRENYYDMDIIEYRKIR